MNAIDLAHAHLAGELDTAEETRYRTLLTTSEEHATALSEARRMRGLLKDALGQAESTPVGPAPDRSPAFWHDSIRWWVPLGATALAGMAMFILQMPPSSLTGGAPPAGLTAPGLSPHAILGDGSRLEWTPDTRFERLKDTGEEIALRLLEGRVTADVVPALGADRRFVILAGDIEVRVLGTRFDVAWDGVGDVHVTVDKGRVLVTSGRQSREVAAGDSASWPGKNRQAPSAVSHGTSNGGAQALKPARTSAEVKPRRRKNASRGIAVNQARTSDSPKSIPAMAPGSPEPPTVSPTAPPIRVQGENSPDTTMTHFKDPVIAELAALIPAINANGCAKTLPRLEGYMRTHEGHSATIDALYLKGYCLYQLGHQEAAIGLWKQVERRQPRTPWLRTVRDWTQPRPPSVSRLR